MKAFEDCDRRRDGRCIQFQHPCVPGMELPVSRKGIDGCWRMCREEVNFLQCPSCEERLWFDHHIANPFGYKDTFYCPKCDKDINRDVAIQTIKCIAEELKEQEKVIEWFGALNLGSTMDLGPRDLDRWHSAEHQVKRLGQLIIEIAKRSA